MELSKKTTILFPPDLHDRLTEIAHQRKTSLGDLVRSACEKQYTQPSRHEKLAAVKRLSALHLPVGTPRQMKRQSVPKPKEILP